MDQIIKFEEASEETKELYNKLIELGVKDLNPNVFMQNTEFLVVMPKEANFDMAYQSNIYIDVDPWEFTIQFGHFHMHISGVDECAEIVRDIYEGRTFSFMLKKYSGMKMYGYRNVTLYGSKDAISDVFTFQDIEEYCRNVLGENEPSDELLEEVYNKLISEKNPAYISYYFYNDIEPTKVNFYLDGDE